MQGDPPRDAGSAQSDEWISEKDVTPVGGSSSGGGAPLRNADAGNGRGDEDDYGEDEFEDYNEDEDEDEDEDEREDEDG